MSVNPKAADEVVEVEEQKAEDNTEAEAQPSGEGDAKVDPEAEVETVATFGETKPAEEPEVESKTFRELRQRLREESRKAKALEAEISTLKAPPQPKLAAKPKLGDDGIDYDEDKFAEATEKWLKQKAAVEAEGEQERQAQQRTVEEHAKKVQRYREGQAAFAESTFKEAESAVLATLNPYQQQILLEADNPTALVVALGNDDATLAELATVTDLARFAMRIGKLETKLTVTKQTKTPPKPARTVNGTAPTSGSSKTLERLEAEAEKTGDRSKVHAYQREQRKKAK